ncbi:MAG: hypothetical protein EBZ59_12675 [Planctomycetia bacterium]|nr:hypothetical protein [Planctomycetia bacterium]
MVDAGLKRSSNAGWTEQSSSSVSSTATSRDSGRRNPALRPSAWPVVPARKRTLEVEGVSAFRVASSCCSKPQPLVPATATQPNCAPNSSGVSIAAPGT